MVDVAEKPITLRIAAARASVTCSREAREAAADGTSKKGDLFATVRIAAITGAKRTSELIPLCHSLGLEHVKIDVRPTPVGFEIIATCRALSRTGVEMEALTAASIGALTLYDMLKAVDKGISFDVRLLEKSGGQRGDYRRKTSKKSVRA